MGRSLDAYNLQSSALPSPDELFMSMARGQINYAGGRWPWLPAEQLYLASGRDSPQPSCSGVVWHASVPRPLKSSCPWHQAGTRLKTHPERGPFYNFHRLKGTICTWTNCGCKNSCHRIRVQETAQLPKVPSSTRLPMPRGWGLETQEKLGINFGCE